MPDAQQSNLFTTPGGEDAPTKMNDHDLLRDVSAAADILAMGSEGIAAHNVLRLRGELLAAVGELARRWHMGVFA